MDNKPTDKGEWVSGIRRIRKVMRYAQDFKRFRKSWLAKAYKSLKKYFPQPQISKT